MKNNFVSIVIAAILGSIITLGINNITNNVDTEKQADTVYKTEKTDTEVPTNHVNFAAKTNKTLIDFSYASEKSVEAVVHIKAKKYTTNRQLYQYRDPIEEFFGWGTPRYYYGKPEKKVQESSGSGVIMAQDGYIVTNNHVIKNADELEVVLNDNRSFKATVIGADPTTDIAVIKIEGSDFPFIEFANSDHVKIGEWVLAVGNPFNLSSTVTAGIVSAKARSINILKEKSAVEAFIQTDAAVNPGNSGGALVNLEGNLIGINTAIATPTGTYAGYSFAVPSNLVAKVVDDLLEYGIVQRAYLGIMIRDMNQELANELDVNFVEGVLVEKMIDNSSAKDAGLKEKDIITHINDQEVRKTPQLLEKVARFRPGQKIKITVLRNGETLNFEVILKNRDGKTEAVTKDNLAVLKTLGIELEELSDEQKQTLKIKNGVLVTQINAGPIKKQTNMQKGYIILKINSQPVRSIEDVQKYLQNVKNKGVMVEGIYPKVNGKFYYAFGL